jgi:MFS superfamily sulfate permease-like transporter
MYNLRLAKYFRSFRSRTPQNRIDETRKLAFDFRENIKPGIITAFISFPLVVAVGAGIGVPPSIGIRAALWALLASVMFGGCRFTVFGPTAVRII